MSISNSYHAFSKSLAKRAITRNNKPLPALHSGSAILTSQWQRMKTLRHVSLELFLSQTKREWFPCEIFLNFTATSAVILSLQLSTLWFSYVQVTCCSLYLSQVLHFCIWLSIKIGNVIPPKSKTIFYLTLIFPFGLSSRNSWESWEKKTHCFPQSQSLSN